VSEESAAKTPAADSGHGAKPAGKPIVLYALVILNMLIVAGVGVMLKMSRQKDVENAKSIDKVAQGMVEDAKGGGEAGKEGAAAAEEEDFVGKMIPMETFLVNPAGNRGNKLLKVNMEFEVEGDKIAEEIDKRKPQIRDIVIILLSSKTYAQLSSPEGKEFLRDEIRDTVNSFLVKGKIKHVHFTEFIVN
jgi:flagellar protein FliL